MFYLSTKSSLDVSKIVAVLRSCAEMLAHGKKAQPRQELVRIDKKLYQCQNPDKIDLLSLNQAQKRNGADHEPEEKALKKRKLEREELERAGEVFGGPIKGDAAIEDI